MDGPANVRFGAEQSVRICWGPSRPPTTHTSAIASRAGMAHAASDGGSGRVDAWVEIRKGSGKSARAVSSVLIYTFCLASAKAPSLNDIGGARGERLKDERDP